MTSKILAFILGIAIGAGICAAMLSKTSDNRSAVSAIDETVVLSNRIAGLESSLASAKAGLERAQKDNDDLATRVQEMMAKEAARPTPPAATTSAKRTGLAALFGGDGTNGTSGPMAEMMKTALEQQIEAKLSGMKAKLNLTPEQETAIRSIMMKQMSRTTEMAQKMLSGETSREELEKLGKEHGKEQPNEESQIKALLTPEQLAAYDDYEKDERSRMARLVANSELMQMQSQLQLSEEQQDKVFAILADQTLSQFDGSKNNQTGALDFRGQSDKKAEALKEVLTPEQYERYKKFQEQQMKLIESFMPKSAPNATVISVTPKVSE